ncbi:MAG TPA: hypothetical protein VML75_04995 [Kofleriaceae bacterium]|nr:hypothetical protein [Kofleriaceae bacterium]
MKLPRLIAAAAATVLVGSLSSPALAQPGAPPPPPPPGGGGYYAQPPVMDDGFFYREGFTLGFGLGFGGMSSDSNVTSCGNCDYEPAAIGLDFHLGGMVNHRLALLGEVWGTGQAVEQSGRTVLIQTMWMFAAQYWVTPQLWIKGGIGVAQLTASYDDGFEDEIDTGGGLMGALGYEILSSDRFSLDLQGRLGSASYDRIGDNITAGTISLGINWY